MRFLTYLIAPALVVALAGCTSGNSAIVPGFQGANLAANVAELAVGVATFTNGTKGLNVVATFRQPAGTGCTGCSGTLLNTPTISGPAGFNTAPVTACASNSATGQAATSGATAGTSDAPNTIAGSPQVAVGIGTTCTTLGTAGGVFAYGLEPENSGTTGAAVFTLYTQPMYTGSTSSGALWGTCSSTTPASCTTGVGYKGGPPAYPATRVVTTPAGFTGYPMGFLPFAIAPKLGAYSLAVAIQDATNNTVTTDTSNTATLLNTTGLAAFAGPPAFAKDGLGGGTATCPASPAGTTETLIEIIDANYSASGAAQGIAAGQGATYYTILVAGAGPAVGILPDLLGVTGANGGTNPSIVAGDTYRVNCVAADYPLYEAGPPQNTSPAPTLLGVAGQADISFSPQFFSTY
jgi:hypothetical protein